MNCNTQRYTARVLISVRLRWRSQLRGRWVCLGCTRSLTDGRERRRLNLNSASHVIQVIREFVARIYRDPVSVETFLHPDSCYPCRTCFNNIKRRILIRGHHQRKHQLLVFVSASGYPRLCRAAATAAETEQKLYTMILAHPHVNYTIINTPAACDEHVTPSSLTSYSNLIGNARMPAQPQES